MKLRSLIPVLDVCDVDVSIEFYCDVLGFEVHDKVEWGGRTEWALIKTEEVQLMLCASQDSGLEERENTSDGVFFLHHENLESLMVYLGTKGYGEMPDVLKPDQGGRDFVISDPDGYVLWFSHKPVGASGNESTNGSTTKPSSQSASHTGSSAADAAGPNSSTNGPVT